MFHNPHFLKSRSLRLCVFAVQLKIMFTGLIESMGRVSGVETLGDARRLRVVACDAGYLSDAAIGESIAVNGTCLTVEELGLGGFSAIAVEETLRRTTLGGLKEGDSLNLERALRADARLGGHIVQGHVDGIATVTAARAEGEGWWVTFEPPFALLRYVVEKGSVCLDGISLTVANLAYNRFSVALIPHTRAATTAGAWQEGVPVNLEVDIIAKYVERLTQWGGEKMQDTRRKMQDS